MSVKVLSLSVNGEPLDGKFDGVLGKKTFVVRQRIERYLVLTAQTEHELSIAGGTYHLVSAERSAGKAAAGAIVGGMIAGGAGLLAGGAMGGGTQSVMSIHYDGVILVAEFSTAELAKLASYGVIAGTQAPGVSSVKIGTPKLPPAGVLGLVVVVAFALAIMCSR